MDKITRPWRYYADFSGRSTRTEFWLFFIVFYVMLMVLFFLPVFIAGANPLDDDGIGEPSGAVLLAFVPVGLFFLAGFIPSLAVSVRRLHDSDKSGWLYLLTFIPYVGFFIFVVFGFLPGTKRENSYGFNPRVDADLQAATAQEIFG